jgi:hypothetical protein
MACALHDRQYIISERLFLELPADEKKYYHSHATEVGCGLLQLVELKGVPTGKVTEAAERPIMTELHKTYGSASFPERVLLAPLSEPPKCRLLTLFHSYPPPETIHVRPALPLTQVASQLGTVRAQTDVPLTPSPTSAPHRPGSTTSTPTCRSVRQCS